MRFLSALLALLFACQAHATITASTSIAVGAGTGSTTCAVTLSAGSGSGAVPANASIFLAIHNRSNETDTISGISDTVNGAWSLNYVTGGPFDSTIGTARVWLAYLNNAASGSPVITITFSGSINSQCAAGWLDSDQGALTFDAAATTTEATSTNGDSGSVSATGSGAVVGGFFSTNAQTAPEPSADGTEVQLSGSSRAFLFYEAYASSGSYTINLTNDNSTWAHIAGSFKEPSASSGLLRRRRS